MFTEIRHNESAADFLQSLATRAKNDVEDAYRRGLLDALVIFSPTISGEHSGLVNDLQTLITARRVKFRNFYSLGMIIHDSKRYREQFLLHLRAVIANRKA